MAAIDQKEFVGFERTFIGNKQKGLKTNRNLSRNEHSLSLDERYVINQNTHPDLEWISPLTSMSSIQLDSSYSISFPAIVQENDIDITMHLPVVSTENEMRIKDIRISEFGDCEPKSSIIPAQIPMERSIVTIHKPSSNMPTKSFRSSGRKVHSKAINSSLVSRPVKPSRTTLSQIKSSRPITATANTTSAFTSLPYSSYSYLNETVNKSKNHHEPSLDDRRPHTAGNRPSCERKSIHMHESRVQKDSLITTDTDQMPFSAEKKEVLDTFTYNLKNRSTKKLRKKRKGVASSSNDEGETEMKPSDVFVLRSGELDASQKLANLTIRQSNEDEEEEEVERIALPVGSFQVISDISMSDDMGLHPLIPSAEIRQNGTRKTSHWGKHVENQLLREALDYAKRQINSLQSELIRSENEVNHLQSNLSNVVHRLDNTLLSLIQPSLQVDTATEPPNVYKELTVRSSIGLTNKREDGAKDRFEVVTSDHTLLQTGEASNASHDPISASDEKPELNTSDFQPVDDVKMGQLAMVSIAAVDLVVESTSHLVFHEETLPSHHSDIQNIPIISKPIDDSEQIMSELLRQSEEDGEKEFVGSNSQIAPEGLKLSNEEVEVTNLDGIDPPYPLTNSIELLSSPIVDTLPDIELDDDDMIFHDDFSIPLEDMQEEAIKNPFAPYYSDMWRSTDENRREEHNLADVIVGQSPIDLIVTELRIGMNDDSMELVPSGHPTIEAEDSMEDVVASNRSNETVLENPTSIEMMASIELPSVVELMNDGEWVDLSTEQQMMEIQSLSPQEWIDRPQDAAIRVEEMDSVISSHSHPTYLLDIFNGLDSEEIECSSKSVDMLTINLVDPLVSSMNTIKICDTTESLEALDTKNKLLTGDGEESSAANLIVSNLIQTVVHDLTDHVHIAKKEIDQPIDLQDMDSSVSEAMPSDVSTMPLTISEKWERMAVDLMKKDDGIDTIDNNLMNNFETEILVLETMQELGNKSKLDADNTSTDRSLSGPIPHNDSNTITYPILDHTVASNAYDEAIPDKNSEVGEDRTERSLDMNHADKELVDMGEGLSLSEIEEMSRFEFEVSPAAAMDRNPFRPCRLETLSEVKDEQSENNSKSSEVSIAQLKGQLLSADPEEEKESSADEGELDDNRTWISKEMEVDANILIEDNNLTELVHVPLATDEIGLSIKVNDPNPIKKVEGFDDMTTDQSVRSEFFGVTGADTPVVKSVVISVPSSVEITETIADQLHSLQEGELHDNEYELFQNGRTNDINEMQNKGPEDIEMQSKFDDFEISEDELTTSSNKKNTAQKLEVIPLKDEYVSLYQPIQDLPYDRKGGTYHHEESEQREAMQHYQTFSTGMITAEMNHSKSKPMEMIDFIETGEDLELISESGMTYLTLTTERSKKHLVSFREDDANLNVSLQDSVKRNEDNQLGNHFEDRNVQEGEDIIFQTVDLQPLKVKEPKVISQHLKEVLMSKKVHGQGLDRSDLPSQDIHKNRKALVLDTHEGLVYDSKAIQETFLDSPNRLDNKFHSEIRLMLDSSKDRYNKAAKHAGHGTKNTHLNPEPSIKLSESTSKQFEMDDPFARMYQKKFSHHDLMEVTDDPLEQKPVFSDRTANLLKNPHEILNPFSQNGRKSIHFINQIDEISQYFQNKTTKVEVIDTNHEVYPSSLEESVQPNHHHQYHHNHTHHHHAVAIHDDDSDLKIRDAKKGSELENSVVSMIEGTIHPPVSTTPFHTVQPNTSPIMIQHPQMIPYHPQWMHGPTDHDVHRTIPSAHDPGDLRRYNQQTLPNNPMTSSRINYQKEIDELKQIIGELSQTNCNMIETIKSMTLAKELQQQPVKQTYRPKSASPTMSQRKLFHKSSSQENRKDRPQSALPNYFNTFQTTVSKVKPSTTLPLSIESTLTSSEWHSPYFINTKSDRPNLKQYPRIDLEDVLNKSYQPKDFHTNSPFRNEQVILSPFSPQRPRSNVSTRMSSHKRNRTTSSGGSSGGGGGSPYSYHKVREEFIYHAKLKTKVSNDKIFFPSKPIKKIESKDSEQISKLTSEIIRGNKSSQKNPLLDIKG